MDAALTSAMPYSSDQRRFEVLTYRPDIDGLRAVAVLAVMCFHVSSRTLPGGFAGVDVFFVISGFLISTIVIRELSTRTFSFQKFYARRVKRIFPALIVVLLSSWLLGWLVLLPDEYKLLGEHTATGAGFVLNLVLYREFNWYFGATTTPLVHLWSLGVEEQFYLIWPLFLAAIWKISRWRLTLLAAIAAASFVLNVLTIRSDPVGSFYLPWTRLWELALGGALAFVSVGSQQLSIRETFSNRLHRLSTVGSHVAGVLGAALLIGSFVSLNREFHFPGWWALLPVLGTLLLIAAGPNGFVNRLVLMKPPMIFVGLISYPLYLWHWPLLTYTRMVEGSHFTLGMALSVVVLSLALAFLVYKYIELPIRSSRKDFSLAFSLGAAMVVCASVGYLNYRQVIGARPAGADVQRFIRAATEDWPPKTVTDWEHMNDLLFLGTAPRKVIFIGDSNMYQYYSRLDELMFEHKSNTRGVVLAARSGCALGTLIAEEDPDCKRFLQKAVEYAKSSDVDVVVLGATWFGHFTAQRDPEHYGEPSPLRPGVDQALHRLRKTIADFVNNDKRVYIILQIPIGVSLDPRQLIRRSVLPPGFTVAAPPLIQERIVKLVEPIDTKLRQVAADAGATVIDPVEFLCDGNICPIVSSDGEPMYFDANHLRPSYVRRHVSYLDKTILDPGLDREVGSSNFTRAR